MVSGFFTSPLDQALICSGDAKLICKESKLLTSNKGNFPLPGYHYSAFETSLFLFAHLAAGLGTI